MKHMPKLRIDDFPFIDPAIRGYVGRSLAFPQKKAPSSARGGGADFNEGK